MKVPEGFTVQAGQGKSGWFGTVLVRPDRDKPFVADLGEIDPNTGAELRPGQTDAAWLDAQRGPVGLRVVLVQDEQSQVLAEGDHIWGPAAADRTHAGSLLAWTQKTDGNWQFVICRDGARQVVAESPEIMCEPAVAEINGAAVVAFRRMTARGPQIIFMTENGREVLATSGRCPRLAADLDRCVLVYEEPNANTCSLQLVEFDGVGIMRQCTLPAGDQLNLAPHLTVDPEDGSVYIVHEGCPAWGHDHFLGRHRDLYLWRLDAGADHAVAAPGRLPPAYRASHDLNEPPVQPRVVLVGGQPAVAFRRFVYYASRPFSWHVYLTRFDGATWTPPARISSQHGLPETDYAVLAADEGLLAGFTYCASRSPLTREDYEAGREARGMPGRVNDTWVEFESLPSDTDHGPVPALPNHVQGEYHISLGVQHAAPTPEMNAPDSAPKQLVWGDLHQHTLWSKCMSPVDGTRTENLRYQRDVLGCRVFSFGEHTTMMSDSEFTYYLDQIEAEAGADGVVLYGTEPWSNGHDTNLYAIDRDVFTRLRLIYQRHRGLGEILREIKKEFPNREVACLRHFHGGGEGEWNVADSRVVNTHIPAIEPAMEAMQIRGNVFLGETDAHPGLPAFPVNFLNAGCRVGLVGGTDHSSDPGPNHFCLTGFWVDNLTPDAVWDALWSRTTIAMANGKISIWAECDKQPIGSEINTPDPVRVRTWLSAARPITRVTLVRDGEVLGWQPVEAEQAEMELVDAAPPAGSHWYSVTAEAESAPDLPRPILGHASPFFTETPD